MSERSDEAREAVERAYGPEANGATPESEPEAPRLELLDLGAIMAEPPPPRDDLLGDYFERGEFFEIVGPGGAGKSVLALALALHLLNPDARTFYGRPVGDVSRLVYIDAENPERIIRRRLHALDPSPALLPRITYARAQGLDLSTRRGRDELARVLGEDALVVLDSARGLHRCDEDKSGEIRPLLDAIRRRCEEAGSTPVLLVHTPHGEERPRGSGEWVNAVDGWASFTKDGVSGVRTLRASKVRDGQEGAELRVRFRSERGLLRIEAADEEPGPSRETVEGVEDQLVGTLLALLRQDPTLERAKLAPLVGRDRRDGTLRRAYTKAKAAHEREGANLAPSQGANGGDHSPEGSGPAGTPGTPLWHPHPESGTEPRWRGDPPDPEDGTS